MADLILENVDLGRLRRLADLIVDTFSTKLIVGLVGTLGAGKTTFTQALAAAAGVDPEEVTSPTFTLLCSYEATVASGPIGLHHLDAYRLSDEDEFLELGVEELFESDQSWVLIEWADRVESVMPPETLWMNLDVAESGHVGVPKRVVTLSTSDSALSAKFPAIGEAMGE